MSVGLERVSGELAGYLSARGVPAVTAFPAVPRREEGGPVAGVSLRGPSSPSAWTSTPPSGGTGRCSRRPSTPWPESCSLRGRRGWS